MPATTFPQLAAVLRRTGSAGRDAAMRALRQEAETIMTEAKRQTPVKSGALKESGKVTEDGGVLTLSFGNASVTYAVYVHENLRARHRVGNAKFLELPFVAALRGMDARLAAAVRAAVGGSAT